MKGYFRNQASSQYQVSIFSYSITQSCEWVAQKLPMATLIVLLGAGGGMWTISEAIAPQIVHADTQRIEISLARQQNETYQDLVNRAEAATLKSIQQSFVDTQMTNVSIMIMGQNHGKIAPVLSLEVDRSEWLSNPALHNWVTYFRSARSLLGFQDVAPTSVEPATETPRNITNSRTDITPTTTTPNQTPTFTGAGSQIPNTSTTPTNVGSAGTPPTSTAVDNTGSPPTTPVNNGTIINTPTTISVPNNNELAPSNATPGATRLIPNTSNNLTPTSPNQNVSPNSTSPAGL